MHTVMEWNSERPDIDALAPTQVAAAMRGAFLMLDRWGVEPRAARRILGQPPERSFQAWKAGKVRHVPNDTLRRIGYLAGIHKALTLLYSNPALAIGWLRRPNSAFGGMAPVDRMAAGDVTDLAAIRAYLDAADNPWS